jgi:hypothetical protein
MPAPRPLAQRKQDTLEALRQPEVDAWVATASDAGSWLVPLSMYWTGDRVVIAIEPPSRTARNVAVGTRLRLGLGPTRDVVMIDAEVEAIVAAADLDPGIGDGYAAQVGWDPRNETDPFVYVTLSPVRIQAWRESNEIAGRTLMRDGAWVA